METQDLDLHYCHSAQMRSWSLSYHETFKTLCCQNRKAFFKYWILLQSGPCMADDFQQTQQSVLVLKGSSSSHTEFQNRFYPSFVLLLMEDVNIFLQLLGVLSKTSSVEEFACKDFRDICSDQLFNCNIHVLELFQFQKFPEYAFQAPIEIMITSSLVLPSLTIVSNLKTFLLYDFSINLFALCRYSLP